VKKLSEGVNRYFFSEGGKIIAKLSRGSKEEKKSEGGKENTRF